jgi:hypothetical protein
VPDQPQKPLPGKGLLGWLGRQVGYVRRAIRHPVAPPSGGVDAEARAQTIYRGQKILEEPMPGNPNITLRRTVVDEAIVNRDNDRTP